MMISKTVFRCTSGFNGSQCENDVDECSIPGTCNNRGNCKNAIGGYTCSCFAGYTGKNCSVDIDECSTDNGTAKCQNGATCKDGVGRFTCECPHTHLGNII